MLWRKSSLLLAFAAIGLSLAVAFAILYWNLPPAPARLLPEANAYLFIDLEPIRATGIFRQLAEVELDPEYQKFVQQTGIQFERDLDQTAMAIHWPGASTAETRYSEVFVGRFDAPRLRAYLEEVADSKQPHRGTDTFSISLPGRVLRVAIPAPQQVIASNATRSELFLAMLDRAKNRSTGSRGPLLLRQYYPHIPAGSPVWAIMRFSPGHGRTEPALALPRGLSIEIPRDTVLLLSLRFIGALELRAEAFMKSEMEAEQLATGLKARLSLFQTVLGAQPDVNGGKFKRLLESFRIQKEKNRVVMSTSADPGLLREIFSASPVAAPLR
jgi:hypothetical protein